MSKFISQYDALTPSSGDLFLIQSGSFYYKVDFDDLAAVLGTSQTLAQTLALGALTGGTDITISNGDVLKSADSNIISDFGSGSYYWLTTDGGTGATGNVYADATSASIGVGIYGFGTDATSSLLSHGSLIKLQAPIIEISNGNIIQSTDANIQMDFGSGASFTLTEVSSGAQFFLGADNATMSVSNGYIAINTTYAVINSNEIHFGVDSDTTALTKWYNSTNGNTVTIQSGVTSASYTLTLPTAQGGANTYLKNDGSGVLTWDAGGGGSTNFDDSVFYIYDNGDNTKKLAFQVSGVTTATTRTLTVPDASGTIALTSDLSAYQPLDSDLTTIAGLTATTDNFIVSVSSAWASRTPSQVRTTLGLVIGTNVQAWGADLDSWAGVTRASGFDTFVATPSSANFAALITGETGTGGVVFDTNAVLTTPTLAATPTANSNGLQVITSAYFDRADDLFADHLAASPSDGAVLYWGSRAGTAPAATDIQQLAFKRSGTIYAATIYTSVSSNLATTETSTIAFGLNATTYTNLSTAVLYDTRANAYEVTGLSIAFTAGDKWGIKGTFATWATNPIGITTRVVLHVRYSS